MLSDEAHTYMHLSYYMDQQRLQSGNRQKLILKALSMFQVKDYDGELILDVSDGSTFYQFQNTNCKKEDFIAGCLCSF